jgi:nicotinamidase-related amidase
VRGEQTALLVVDMLNTYEHDDADRLAASVKDAVPQIAGLIERARRDSHPLVYVNDNYGDWNSSCEELAKRAMAGRHPDLVEPLLPRADDAFVIKARHSVFYSTPLEYLLQTMDVGRIVLAGQATEQCIARAACEMMERNMHAQIRPAADVRLG